MNLVERSELQERIAINFIFLKKGKHLVKSKQTLSKMIKCLIMRLKNQCRLNQYGNGIKREVDQWNRIECPKINQLIYYQVIFDKGVKKMQ